MLLHVLPHQTIDTIKTWTLSIGNKESQNKNFINNPRPKKTQLKGKLRCCSFREFSEVELNRMLCMKVKKRDLLWLKNCLLLLRYPIYLRVKLNKFFWNNTKKNSEMPCMKDFKVKLSPKHLMNCRRSLFDTLNKRGFVKKFNKHKKKEDNVKFSRQVAETLRKLSELVNNVFMNKSWKWTKVQSIVTWTGSLTTLLKEPLIDKQVSWPI